MNRFIGVIILGFLFVSIGCGGGQNTVTLPANGGLTEAQLNKVEPNDEVFTQGAEQGSKR